MTLQAALQASLAPPGLSYPPMPGVMALDTETELTTPQCKAPRLVCVSHAWGGGLPGLFKWNGDDGALGLDVEEWFRSRLHSSLIWVGHFIAYDWAVIANECPALVPDIFEAYERDQITCVMLRQKLLWIAEGEVWKLKQGDPSLEKLAKELLGVDSLDKGAESWRTRYGELRDVPLVQWPERARLYPVNDVRAPLAAYSVQQELRTHGPGGRDLLEDEFRQARYSFALRLMSCWGMPVDLERVEKLAVATEREYQELKDQLLNIGLVRANGTKDTKLAKARMIQVMGSFDRCKQTSGGTSGKKDVSLDEEACIASGDDSLIAYSRVQKLGTVLSKDIDALRQGRIHPRINSLLISGRISAGGNSDDGGYNTTNVGRTGGFRECFISDPGTVIIDNDYGGLELCTWSQACYNLIGMTTMGDVINAGEDPHLMLAGDLAGTTYADAKARYAGHKLYKETKGVHGAIDKLIAAARQNAKPGNFGYPGGMGPDTYVIYCAGQGVKITRELALAIKHIWQKNWPESAPWFDMSKMATMNGYATVEQLYSKRFRGGLSFCDYLNTLFQGLGADLAKSAFWRVCRESYDWTQRSVLLGCRPLNFVHDQILTQAPLETAHEAAQRQTTIMNEEGRRWCPDVPPKTEAALSYRWSKDAVAVYDKHERLVPWEPVQEAA